MISQIFWKLFKKIRETTRVDSNANERFWISDPQFHMLLILTWLLLKWLGKGWCQNSIFCLFLYQNRNLKLSMKLPKFLILILIFQNIWTKIRENCLVCSAHCALCGEPPLQSSIDFYSLAKLLTYAKSCLETILAIKRDEIRI